MSSSQQDDLLASVSSTRLFDPANPLLVAPDDIAPTSHVLVFTYIKLNRCVLELIPQLQSSMRNALATFGPASPQYIGIKYVVDEHMAKAALQGLSLESRKNDETKDQNVSGHTVSLAFRPRGT
jgi:hypothetical protein